ncbi:hypothetical protein Lesp02_84920 [Lentzea sp. NBRC 105346]|uniref:MarR family transcriptional regulator n=1 Tax=Lentzea sp. NBRC 105346 TaxID=3032205 RepID=UPI0024A3F701|nr:MarR family transcriptional regulator [Lentzea sp. NBRC 105346]GLZ36305.1 hypothetical protein Lesp02_84920 [Lentzea sp. NBRC 105346]
MTTDQRDRQTVIAEVQKALRDNASWGLLLHQTIAARFGLNPTDLKCLDLARREKDLTAGQLATITGLSNSAVTAVLNRLENAGLILRKRDEQNRRRVFVLSTGRHELGLRDAYAPLTVSMREHLDQYDDEQLDLILNFTLAVGKITQDMINQTAQAPG